jgi:hypothetical protein
MTTTTIRDALTAGAAGLHPTEAAIDLLIATGLDHRLVLDWSEDHTMGFVDWTATLDQPLSGGEHRVIRIARQLYEGDIDVSSLDADKITAITNAIRHASTGAGPGAGQSVFLHRDDYPGTVALLATLPAHGRDDGLIAEGRSGLVVDWDGLIARSRLSSTEIGLVHAARALAVFEHHGTSGPFQAVAAAVARLDPQ